MVDAKTVSMYGIIGVLIMASGGTLFYLSQEQLNNTYICPLTNVTGIFEKLSSSNKTGYWTINGTTKQATCTNSAWIKLDTWCVQNNINCSQFISNGIPIKESNFDEFGNEIIKTNTITVNQSKNININGTIYTIDYKPVIQKEYINVTQYVDRMVLKCICDETTVDCIKRCVQ